MPCSMGLVDAGGKHKLMAGEVGRAHGVWSRPVICTEPDRQTWQDPAGRGPCSVRWSTRIRHQGLVLGQWPKLMHTVQWECEPMAYPETSSVASKDG